MPKSALDLNTMPLFRHLIPCWEESQDIHWFTMLLYWLAEARSEQSDTHLRFWWELHWWEFDLARPPNIFCSAEATQIPALRRQLHYAALPLLALWHDTLSGFALIGFAFCHDLWSIMKWSMVLSMSSMHGMGCVLTIDHMTGLWELHRRPSSGPHQQCTSSRERTLRKWQSTRMHSPLPPHRDACLCNRGELDNRLSWAALARLLPQFQICACPFSMWSSSLCFFGCV